MKIKHLQLSVKCRCGEMLAICAEKLRERIPVFTNTIACADCGIKYHTHIQEDRHEERNDESSRNKIRALYVAESDPASEETQGGDAIGHCEDGGGEVPGTEPAGLEEFRYDCYVGMLKAERDHFKMWAYALAMAMVGLVILARYFPHADHVCRDIEAKYQKIIQHESASAPAGDTE